MTAAPFLQASTSLFSALGYRAHGGDRGEQG
jgi:hypothetical protein